MKFAHQIRVEVYAIFSGMVPVAERNEQTVPLRVLPIGTTEDMMDLDSRTTADDTVPEIVREDRHTFFSHTLPLSP